MADIVDPLSGMILGTTDDPPAESLPYDPTFPFDRPGALINKGCPPGYFAQIVPASAEGSVYVKIPGIVQGSWMRCRLMATTTVQTNAEESGQAAAQSWYNLTNTGLGAGFGDFLKALGWIPLAIGGYIAWQVIKELRR